MPSEDQAPAKRNGSLYRPVTLLKSIRPAPSLGPPTSTREADISCWHPQGQAPRPCPAFLTEGARHPGPSRPSGSSGCPNRGRRRGVRSHRLFPKVTATAIKRRRWRRGAPLPQGLGQRVATSEPCRTRPSACSQATHLTHRPESGGPRREKHHLPLTLLPTPRTTVQSTAGRA